MVIKSLTITGEAYDALRKVKGDGESFSRVILKITRGRSSAVDKYFGVLKMSPFEILTLKNKIANRRKEIEVEYAKRKNKLHRILIKDGSP